MGWMEEMHGQQRDPAVYYWCNHCKREIQFGCVEMMGAVHDNSFYLSHSCACEPGVIFERRFQVDHAAIRRMLGKLRPVIPYRAAPAAIVQLPAEQERIIKIFHWEVQTLTDVDEFLLLTKRPGRENGWRTID